jgi:hypothetical protein
MREMRLKEEASHSKDTRYNSNKPSLAEIGQVIKGVSEALTSFNEGMQAIDRSPRPKTTSGYKPSTSGYKSSTNGYKSSTGRIYEYDLSKPLDRLRYRVDPKAKLRDRLDINPQRRIERNIGQYGGGVFK